MTLEDIFGAPFQSSNSTTFVLNEDFTKPEFGCLVSVKEDITIHGATSFTIPQAKIIAKAVTDERKGNFLGLGRPVAETPYTSEIEAEYYQSSEQTFVAINDYNKANYDSEIESWFLTDPSISTVAAQNVGFGAP